MTNEGRLMGVHEASHPGISDGLSSCTNTSSQQMAIVQENTNKNKHSTMQKSLIAAHTKFSTSLSS